MDIGGNNRFFFYISLGDKAATMEYTYDLTEEIDDGILMHAVRDAVEAFPFFQLKPFIGKDGRLMFLKNEADVPVQKDDGEKKRLGTADTNGYLFRVTYAGNRITVIAFHGIADGRGVSSFAQTVVYYYLSGKGIRIDTQGLVYTRECLNDPTVTDILQDRVASAVFQKTEPKAPGNDGLFYPMNEKKYLGTPDTRQFRIIWDQDMFMKAVKPLGGTPATFINSVLARTMYEFYGLSDKRIVANVPVDLRERLNSRAQSNFTTNVDLDISEKDLQLDIRTLMTELRARLKEATDINSLLSGVAAFGSFCDYLENIPLDNDEMVDRLTVKLTGRVPVRTYLLSNIGVVRLPDGMAPYVTNVDIAFTNLEATPVFTMLTYKNRGTLIIGQNYEDDGFVKALCGKLKEYGIETEFLDCGLVRSDAVRVRDFDRL